MKNLVLFGMQGAGKGTQAKLLAAKYGFTIFEAGAELRKLMTESTPLAQKVHVIVERGDLVPNEIVMEIIANFLAHVPSTTPILFDGIPRSMAQKESMMRLLATHQREVFAVFIEIPRAEALERLMKRGRSDDNAAAIERRLENYERETLPVIEAFEQEGILTRVQGIGSIEDIQERITKIVDTAS